MTDRRDQRRVALVSGIVAAGVDALLVTHLPNVRWLTGFTGSAASLVITAMGEAVLVTDFRYQIQAPAEVGGAAEVVIERKNVPQRLKKILADLRVERLGVEADFLTIGEVGRLEELGGWQLVPLTELVERLRQIKDPDEIRLLRAAATLAHEALAEVLPSIRVGQSELAIAARLESALRMRGSEWHPFHTIVASGPRSALPHATASEREVRKGEFLLIDYGAQVGGYCSDLTRTFVVGASPDQQQREVYQVVKEAHQRARNGIQAGMTGIQADGLARNLISERGFGEAFGHSLGHGLGLEVHEMPRLSPTSEGTLSSGVVVTIEPGIYLEGWGGVRLEDDIWLSPEGPVLLSDGAIDQQTLEF